MRSLTIASVILLLVLAFTPSLASASMKHGCASVYPSAVSGTLMQPTATRGILFINEILLTPHSTWNCSELGTYNSLSDTWLEIYNAQNQPFDLYSVHASIDSGPNTNPFYLPFGSAIAPYGFLTIFPRLSSSFLATETSTWRLLVGGVPVDEVTIPILGEDQSYARIPDGSPTWIITSTPTIATSNTTSLIQSPPTKTTVEVTATAHAARSKKGAGGVNRAGTGSNGDTYGNGSGTGSGQQQVAGVQPTWKSLKHPDLAVTPPSATIQSSNSIVPVSNNNLDVPHKILLTLLVAALIAVLFWCWRLFRAT